MSNIRPKDLTATKTAGQLTGNEYIISDLSGDSSVSKTLLSQFVAYLNGQITLSGSAGGDLSGTYPNPTVLNSAVLGKVLTGFTSAAGTVASSDNILQGIEKLDGNIAGIVNSKGVANGIATLDSGGKIPTSQLPSSVVGGLNYQGTWNASTNTPTLASGVGTKGYYYKVSVAGTTSIDGNASWVAGDWIVFDGTTWDKVDNYEAVTSVFGRIGNVVAVSGDYNTSQVTESGNLYFTTGRVDSRVQAYTGDVTLGGTTFSIGAGKVTNAMLAGGITDANISSASVWNAKQNALGFTPENVANKATDFSTINNTKYPTTQAVDSNYWSQSADEVELALVNSYATITRI